LSDYNTIRTEVELCAELKEILSIIFGLILLAGLVVFQIRFIKDRNPNAELLNDLLRWMSANKKTDQTKEPQEDGQG
jgi:hypothetical protein